MEEKEQGTICFWCGRYINPEDEGKQKTIRSYIPCNKCKKIMDDSVTIMECLKDVEDSKIPPIETDKEGAWYPTGRWVGIDYNSKIAKENKWYKGDVVTCDKEYMDKLVILLKSIIAKERK